MCTSNYKLLVRETNNEMPFFFLKKVFFLDGVDYEVPVWKLPHLHGTVSAAREQAVLLVHKDLGTKFFLRKCLGIRTTE